MKFDFSYAEYEKLKERCPFKTDELRIFELKRRGYSNVYISIELDIPISTLKRKIKSIITKISKELDNI